VPLVVIGKTAIVAQVEVILRRAEEKVAGVIDGF